MGERGCGVNVCAPPLGGVLWGETTHRPHALHTVSNRHHTHNPHRRPVGARSPAPNGEHMSDDGTTPADDLEGSTEPVPGASEPAVTVRQAARALGLTREHVYARIRAGSIRAIDGPGAKGQGTVRLVPLSEIERLVVEQGPRAHGEVKPAPADSRPMLQLERVTQRLESTRAVLSEAVDAIAEPVAGGWWGRRQRERERMARLEAALRAAHAAADAGAPETATD